MIVRCVKCGWEYFSFTLLFRGGQVRACCQRCKTMLYMSIDSIKMRILTKHLKGE